MKTQGPKLVLSLWLSVLAGAQFGPWHQEGQPCLTCLGCYKTSRSQQESAQLWGGSGGLPGICAVRNNHTGPPCWTWPAQELPLWLLPAGSPPQHGPQEWVAEAGETLSSVHGSHREATLVTLHSKAFKNHLNYCGVQNALLSTCNEGSTKGPEATIISGCGKMRKAWTHCECLTLQQQKMCQTALRRPTLAKQL